MRREWGRIRKDNRVKVDTSMLWFGGRLELRTRRENIYYKEICTKGSNCKVRDVL